MSTFDLEFLLIPGALIFVVTGVVTLSVVRSVVVSLIAAAIKSGTFILYFAFLFDGTFTFSDDLAYIDGGVSLLDEGVTLWNLNANWAFTLMIGGGDHFLYFLYNAYAFRYFGVGYYAPVAMNIILTVFIAWVGYIIGAREFGFIRNWGKIFFLFLLFHPDIFAWSNVMNGKDILVLFFHVMLLFSISLFFEGKVRASLIIALPIVWLLFYLRFYVPILIAGVLIYQKMFSSGRTRTRFFALVSVFILIAFLDIYFDHLIPDAITFLQENPRNLIIGFIYMCLTPIPFGTEPSYSFLDFPAQSCL